MNNHLSDAEPAASGQESDQQCRLHCSAGSAPAPGPGKSSGPAGPRWRHWRPHRLCPATGLEPEHPAPDQGPPQQHRRHRTPGQHGGRAGTGPQPDRVVSRTRLHLSGRLVGMRIFAPCVKRCPFNFIHILYDDTPSFCGSPLFQTQNLQPQLRSQIDSIVSTAQQILPQQQARASAPAQQAPAAAAAGSTAFTGLVGSSGVIGPSGLVGPAGPVAFGRKK